MPARRRASGALVDLVTAVVGYVDGMQEASNPYGSGTADHDVFRLHWYTGYATTTIGLSVLGAGAAKAVVQGLKASTVLSKISGALGDLGDASRVTQLVNRLKGIGPLDSRISSARSSRRASLA